MMSKRWGFFIALALCGAVAMTFNNCSDFKPQFSGPYTIDDGTQGLILPVEDFSPKSADEMAREQNLFADFDISGQPNILFIITDDHPYTHFGVMGNSTIRTPHIDALARQGVLFRNFYLPNGQCVPSRGAFWMSQSPYTIGLHANGRNYNANESKLHIGNQLTLPDVLTAAGYETAFFGKCHLGAANKFNYYSRNAAQSGRFFRNLVLFEHGSLLHPLIDPNNHWTNFDYHRLPGGLSDQLRDVQRERETGTHVTEFITDESIDFLERWRAAGRTRPFFMWVSHFAPHLPTTPPEGANLYRLDQLPDVLAANDDLSTKPLVQQHSPSHWTLNPGLEGEPRTVWESFLPTDWEEGRRPRGPEYVRRMMKDAYEVTTHLDAQIGRLMDSLTPAERANTIIVFTSDNGLHYGEHQLFQKGPFFYDTQTRVPLIIAFPGRLKGRSLAAGRSSEALVSSLDVAPTLLEALGIRQPRSFKGESFIDTLSAPETPHRDYLRFEYHEQGARVTPVRGGKYGHLKFSHYLTSSFCPKGANDCEEEDLIQTTGLEFELYDLSRDPQEEENLLFSADPAVNRLDQFVKARNRYSRDLQRLLRGSAIWATVSPDNSPRNKAESLRRAERLSLEFKGNGQIDLFWSTALPSYAAVVWAREGESAQHEYMDFAHVKRHRAQLRGIVPEESYQAVVYSIGDRGRGRAAKLSFRLSAAGEVEFAEITARLTSREILLGEASVVVPSTPLFDQCLIIGGAGRQLDFRESERGECQTLCHRYATETAPGANPGHQGGHPQRRCLWGSQALEIRSL